MNSSTVIYTVNKIADKKLTPREIERDASRTNRRIFGTCFPLPPDDIPESQLQRDSGNGEGGWVKNGPLRFGAMVLRAN